MKHDHISHTSDWTQNWNGSIAIKLTAIILWSVMIVGFVFTVPIMLTYEDQKLKDYQWNNQQLINLVETSINSQQSQSDIENQLKKLIGNSGVEYISINTGDMDISLGVSSEENYQFPTTRILTESNQKITINIQYHALKRALIIDRIIFGSSILVGAILFGIFIFMVTQNVVNKPLHRFVELTHKLSSGERDVRFDEIRDDEFGELARFSNQMLDNLELQREKLINANDELVSEIQNREEALAASQQKSAFLANMSHEIRTPLSSIIGYTERLRYKNIKTEDEKNEMMDIVLQSSGHLLNLINDILDFSKIEANKLEVVAEEFSIISTVSQTVNLLRDKAMEQSTQIKIEYNFPLPNLIHNDATRTKQILLNLCSNAIRFTKNGIVTLRISFDQTNNQLVIAIKDTGIGMPEKALDRLFKPFSQGETNTGKNYGGTGLGLSISKKLSELMGGEISVQSTEGLGSIFTFRINAGFETGQALLHEIDKTAIASDKYNKPIEGLTLSGKVLLVEDTIEIRKLVKAYLEDYGVDITTAENGKQGVEFALDGGFDVVLMDIQMPIMNGKEAVKLLRENNYTGPIIALTADALTQQVEEYMALGFTQILTKPVIINQLLGVLSTYLDSSTKHNKSVVTLQTKPQPKNASVDDALKQLREEFIGQLQQKIDDISTAIDNSDHDAALAMLHKLKGIGGSLDFPEISDQAKIISDHIINDGMESAKQILIGLKKHAANI